jgi:hypothetical protein
MFSNEFDVPQRGDVVVQQQPTGGWQLHDHAGCAVGRIEYEDLIDALGEAGVVARRRGGDVWTQSANPPRIARVPLVACF